MMRDRGRGKGQETRGERQHVPTPHAPRPTPRNLRPDGFTLTEIIIVAALFLILGAGLLTTFLTGQTSYLSADAYIQVQQEARKALDNMVRELREAGWRSGKAIPVINITGTATQLDFQIALGYNLAAPCPSSAVCWGAKDQNGTDQYDWSVRYAETAGPDGTTQLVRQIIDAANNVQPGTRVLANYVDADNTSFSYDNGTRTVTINLRIQYTNPRLPGGNQNTGITPLTSRVRLRNS